MTVAQCGRIQRHLYPHSMTDPARSSFPNGLALAFPTEHPPKASLIGFCSRIDGKDQTKVLCLSVSSHRRYLGVDLEKLPGANWLHRAVEEEGVVAAFSDFSLTEITGSSQ